MSSTERVGINILFHLYLIVDNQNIYYFQIAHSSDRRTLLPPCDFEWNQTIKRQDGSQPTTGLKLHCMDERKTDRKNVTGKRIYFF